MLSFAIKEMVLFQLSKPWEHKSLNQGMWPTVENQAPSTREVSRLPSMWSEVTQSCPTLCNLMDCSPPGFSVHGIFQARILEWVAISFSRASSRPRDQTRVSHNAGRLFTIWATRETPYRAEIEPRSPSQPEMSACKSLNETLTHAP